MPAPRRPYRIVYDADVGRHLLKIENRQHSLIRRGIEKQLRHEPLSDTRNRKPLLAPSILGAAWELRLGPQNRLRVFYRVERRLREVRVLAVGLKERSRLIIGGQEFSL